MVDGSHHALPPPMLFPVQSSVLDEGALCTLVVKECEIAAPVLQRRQQLRRQFSQLYFVLGYQGKAGQGLSRIIVATVEASVDERLQPAPQRREESGNEQCRDYDDQRRTLPAQCLGDLAGAPISIVWSISEYQL